VILLYCLIYIIILVEVVIFEREKTLKFLLRIINVNPRFKFCLSLSFS